MTKYIVASLFTIFLIGCAGGSNSSVSTPIQSNNLPSWAINATPSNPLYYYAVGEGSSKDEAKKNALKQISSQISVTISSSTTSTKIATNTQYSKKIEDITKSSTKKINFTGAKVLKYALSNGTWYANTQVDRNILFEAQKSTMLSEYTKSKKLWNRLVKNNVLELFKEFKNLNTNISKVMAILPILKSINNNFDTKIYMNTMESIRLDVLNKKAKAIVYVKTKNAFNEKAIVEKAFSDFGIKSIKRLSNVKNKNNLLLVSIDKKVKPATNRFKSRKMKNVKFADVTLTITTFEGKGKIKLAQNIIHLKNGSRDSYKDAKNKTKKFELEIEKKGILNILLSNISK